MARLVIFVLTALLLTVLVGPSRANSAEVEFVSYSGHQVQLHQIAAKAG